MKKKLKTNDSRAHVFFKGRVQGVGFRYTAERIALELKLVGWVKNLPDGRVELVSEGAKETIEELLALIKKSQVGPHVKQMDCVWEKPTGEFSDFTVEFYL